MKFFLESTLVLHQGPSLPLVSADVQDRYQTLLYLNGNTQARLASAPPLVLHLLDVGEYSMGQASLQ